LGDDDVSAVDALLEGRRHAEERMVDECDIHRPGETVTDNETGNVTNTTTLVYSGKCEVKSNDNVASSTEAGEATFTVVSRVVKIPANSADVQDGDVVTLTASRLNSFTVGKQYRVDGFEPDSFDTAARLPVKIL
jgi:hypothetical protein